jgi:Phage terminase, small subunit
MKNITARHRRFVEEYCGDAQFNGAEAARQVGYAESRARVTASELLADPDIRAMIKERLDELAMSAAEATKRLGDIARADIGDFFKVVEEEDGTQNLVLDKKAVAQMGGGIIKEISFDQNGRPKIKLYDAQRALEKILKGHGEFKHKQEHEHSGELGIESDTLDDVMESITDRAQRLGDEENTGTEDEPELFD